MWPGQHSWSCGLPFAALLFSFKQGVESSRGREGYRSQTDAAQQKLLRVLRIQIIILQGCWVLTQSSTQELSDSRQLLVSWNIQLWYSSSDWQKQSCSYQYVSLILKKRTCIMLSAGTLSVAAMNWGFSSLYLCMYWLSHFVSLSAIYKKISCHESHLKSSWMRKF